MMNKIRFGISLASIIVFAVLTPLGIVFTFSPNEILTRLGLVLLGANTGATTTLAIIQAILYNKNKE